MNLSHGIESIYTEHHNAVQRFFFRATGDWQIAADLTAETFVAALAALPSFRGETDEEALGWLWAIARNQRFRWSYRTALERRALEQHAGSSLSSTTAEFERVEHAWTVMSVRTELALALEALPANQRQAVTMRIVDELPYSEIASHQNTSKQVARARVSRGLRTLKGALDRHRRVVEGPPKQASP